MNMTTNWDKALTSSINLTLFREEAGEQRVQQMILSLLAAGGTFAISQDNLHLSDFSMLVFRQSLADMTTGEDKPNHFEIVFKASRKPAHTGTFATFDEALTVLVEDPLFSSNANHPFFWADHYQIVLCGGDGCELTSPDNSASL